MRRKCVHGSRVSECVNCKGGNICLHNKRRHRCSECLTTEQKANNNHFCKCCLDKYLTMKRRRANVQLCATCDSGYVKRTEEIVRPLLLLDLPPPSGIDNLTLGGASCNVPKRRPDLVWFGTDRAIFLEIDENGGHPDRLSSCELAKIWDQTIAIKKLLGEHLSIYFLRFNPDACDRIKLRLETRCETVSNEIKRILQLDVASDTSVPNVAYFYYHTKCQFQIDAALAEPNSLAVYKVI